MQSAEEQQRCGSDQLLSLNSDGQDRNVPLL